MKFSERVLVVDDDPKVIRSIRSALADVAPIYGYESPMESLVAVRQQPFACAIVDQRMPEMQGTELLKEIRKIRPETVRFLLTGFADLNAMAEAINESQVHRYIEKPWDVDRLVRDVEAAIEAYRYAVAHADEVGHLEAKSAALEEENVRLRMRIRNLRLQDDILTADPEMCRVLETVQRIAKVSDVVLIYGESGTGKELVARRVHSIRHGPKAPFVALNCGAFSEGLVESELFGHEKGAFTGAVRDFPGAFERASGGTLFLDEVGDLRPDLQVKLLRVLESSLIRRVGGMREIDVSVSVLAATHRDLRSMVSTGEFREDLFFRLSVIELHIPPLRDRKEDIPLLLEHFLKQARVSYNRPGLVFSPEAVEALVQHSFPGNVRELRNLVRKIAALVNNDVIRPGDLPPEIDSSTAMERPLGKRPRRSRKSTRPMDHLPSESTLLEPTEVADLREARSRAKDEAAAGVERSFLAYWHDRCHGNLTQMARATGLSRGYLYKMAKRAGFLLGKDEPG